VELKSTHIDYQSSNSKGANAVYFMLDHLRTPMHSLWYGKPDGEFAGWNIHLDVGTAGSDALLEFVSQPSTILETINNIRVLRDKIYPAAIDTAKMKALITDNFLDATCKIPTARKWMTYARSFVLANLVCDKKSNNILPQVTTTWTANQMATIDPFPASMIGNLKSKTSLSAVDLRAALVKAQSTAARDKIVQDWCSTVGIFKMDHKGTGALIKHASQQFTSHRADEGTMSAVADGTDIKHLTSDDMDQYKFVTRASKLQPLYKRPVVGSAAAELAYVVEQRGGGDVEHAIAQYVMAGGQAGKLVTLIHYALYGQNDPTGIAQAKEANAALKGHSNP